MNTGYTLYLQAINHWGKEAQMDMALEELDELSLAILHHRRGKVGIPEIVDEMADVYIMLGQLEIILGTEHGDQYLLTESLNDRISFKLNRLAERLKNEPGKSGEQIREGDKDIMYPMS